MGAHQKIDRLAAKQLKILLNGRETNFPKINNVIHFEGNNGPDAIKRKSPLAKDEPWHFIQPDDDSDVELLAIIKYHYDQLVNSIRADDEVRAGFEAAWLAHAMVDGLTPAHHFPYGDKVSELLGGISMDEREGVKDRILMSGATVSKMLVNNWRFWGPKGIFLTHAAFELGIATILKPIQYTQSICEGPHLAYVDSSNIQEWYRQTAKSINKFDFYDRFYKDGWTRSLASDVRKHLIPVLVRAVTLAWYGAAIEAES